MQTSASLSIPPGRVLFQCLLRVGGRVVFLSFSGPLDQSTSIMNINHDIGILDIRRERLSFRQFICLPLAMELDPIPPHTHYFNPIMIEGIGCWLVCSFDMDTRDHPVGSKLVMTRRARSTHQQRLTIFGKHQRWNCGQRCSFRGSHRGKSTSRGRTRRGCSGRG